MTDSEETVMVEARVVTRKERTLYVPVLLRKVEAKGRHVVLVVGGREHSLMEGDELLIKLEVPE